ncbi:MAG: T9SS type A sorting domain-containing protein [Bacteroidales bacterium]|nr:T9SS type A sorting domain-containing protein [Bacteroidales bacterium]
MKKIGVFFTVFIWMLFLASSTFAQQFETTLTLPTKTAKKGDVVVVSIKADGLQDFDAFYLGFTYDNTVLIPRDPATQNPNAQLSGWMSNILKAQASDVDTAMFVWVNGGATTANVPDGEVVIEFLFDFLGGTSDLTFIPGMTSVQKMDLETFEMIEFNVTVVNGNISEAGDPPVIIDNPANAGDCEEGQAQFTVNAENATTYKWQESIDGATWNDLTETPPYSGVATNALTINPLANSMNGYQYQCIVGNENDEVISTPATLTVNAFPVAEITPAGPINLAFGENVDLTATISEANFEWYKDDVKIDGAVGQIFNVTEAGNYYVMVTTNGCTKKSNIVEVKFLNEFTIDVKANPDVICAGESSELTVTPVGGSGNYTYKWDTENTEAVITVQPTVTTTYYVTVNDGEVNVEGSVVVTVNPIPEAVITDEGNTTVCAGQKVTLFGKPAEGNIYQWYKDANEIIGANTENYEATETGEYTLKVTNNGCSSVSNAINVTVNPAPEAIITPAGPIDLMPGENILLNANTGENLAYQWQLNGEDIEGAIDASYDVLQNDEGTYKYTVIITNTLTNCSATSNEVIVNYAGQQGLNITVTANPEVLCAGNSSELTVVAKGGTGVYDYKWDTQETTDIITVTPDVTTTYNVTVSDGNETVEGSVIVTVNPIPVVDLTAEGETTFCQGGSVVLNATQTEGYIYNWMKDGVTIEGVNLASYTATEAGIYTVEVTQNDCKAVSAEITVVVNPIPEAIVNPVGPVNLQVGEQVELNANAGNYNYQWLLEGQDITDATNSVYTVNQATVGTYNYSVVVTDIITGCQKTSEVVVVNYTDGTPALTVDVIANPGVLCAGESSELTATAQGGLGSYTYTWDTQETTDIITVTPDVTTTYNVTVSDGNETVEGSVIVTVNPIPVVDLAAEGETTFCQGGSVVLNATQTEGYIYNWMKDGVTIEGVNLASYTATEAGIYTVEVTQNGCKAVSAEITVVVNPIPEAIVNPVGPVNLQIGEQVELNANAGNYNYQWLLEGQNITDAINAAYTVSQTTVGTYNYSVVVTDIITGCQKTSEVVVVNYTDGTPALTVDVIANPRVLCAGESSELTATAQGGLGNYTYTWDTQETTNIITVTPAQTTTYSVTVTDGNETVNGSVVVTVNALPDAIITPAGPTTFCDGNSVVLNATQGEGYSYKWLMDGNQVGTEASYTATMAGNYTLEVTANNCKSVSSPITVVVNAAPNATVTPTGPIVLNEGENITLEATEKGLSYQWRKDGQDIPGATNDTYNVTETGNYTVNVASNGCSKVSDIVMVTVGLGPCPMVAGLNTTAINVKGATLNWNSNNTPQVTYLVRLAQKGTTNYRYRKTSNLSLVFDDLLPNTTYFWAVKAFCVTKPNNLGYTNAIEFTTTNDFCYGATNLEHLNIKQHSATVKWTGTASATLYKIRYYIQGTTNYKYIKTTNTEYTFTWLKSNSTYIWQIKTICGNINKNVNYEVADQFTTLPLKKMNNSANEINLSVYPNPSNGMVNITVSGLTKSANIIITNIEGQQIFNQTLTSDINNEYDFSNLAKGLYFIKIVNENNVITEKLIIQ